MWLRTRSALVVRRCRDDDRVPRGGERGVEGADVELCPAVVVGEEDVCGGGEEGEDGQGEGETHGWARGLGGFSPQVASLVGDC